MKTNRWRIEARDPSGRAVTVVRRGPTPEHAARGLRDAGWQPLRTDPLDPLDGGWWQRPPGPDRVAGWIGALRTVVESGMPLATGLGLLAKQFGDPRLRAVSNQAAREISQGMSLSAALAHAPPWFPGSVKMLVRCGEQSGRLPESLAEAQRQLDRSAATRRRIVTAAAYPVATLVLSAVVVGVLVPWILPTFEKIYQDLRAPLPPTTRALLALWHAVADHAAWFGLGLVGSVVGAVRGMRTPRGRRVWEAFQQRIPGWGPWLRDVALGDGLGALAGMLETGVPLVDALLAVSDSSGHPAVRDALADAAREVSAGGSVSESWNQRKGFPPLLCGMVSMGETTGTLPDVLRRACSWMDDSVDTRLRRALSVLEPTLIVVVGAVVGGLLVALYHPIFTLPETLLKAK